MKFDYGEDVFAKIKGLTYDVALKFEWEAADAVELKESIGKELTVP